MSTTDDKMITDQPVPTGNQPTGQPQTLPLGRDLAKEKNDEMTKERADARSKETDRFRVRKFANVEKRAFPSAPEFETIIFRTAANYPFQDLVYPTVSTYVPNMAPFFYILNYMDHLMCNTRKWTENCLGWAPPISQMYFTVLILVQIFRAMESAGICPHDGTIFLQTFERTFSYDDLWIPGPLVAAFRALSAFRPDANDLFASVTVNLPATPGHTAARIAIGNYVLDPNVVRLLPNLNIFLSRLRNICTVATTANMTEDLFMNSVNGPRRSQNLFGTQSVNNVLFQNYNLSPGSTFIYGGNLNLWQNAARFLTINSIPTALNAATPTHVNNTWTGTMRFDNNEHVWFSPVFALMSKYSQFWNGSVALSEISPTSSAAGSVKMRQTFATTMYQPPAFVPAVVGPPAVPAYFTMRSDARFVNDAQVAVRDVPDAHIYAAITYGFNSYHDFNSQNANRLGRFWQLGPDVRNNYTIEVLPGILQVITREYHRDTRIDAHKQ